MPLPLSPPLAPQLARRADALPVGDGWVYEPKLDGFRAIAFVDGDARTLLSRGGKDLSRYFPEVTFPPGRYVLDGELVIAAGAGAPQAEDFNALSQRIHPAASRIARLAREVPAVYAAFDVLAVDDDVLTGHPFGERRTALEALAAGWDDALSVRLVEQVDDGERASRWLTGRFEGVVAKETAAPYRPGERKGAVKVKRLRTADCVVAGYRPGKEAGTVGSLMLGVYDDTGALVIVGHTSGLKAAEKRALVAELAPLATGREGRADPSRWRNEEDLQWVELRPERVVEIAFDQVSGARIRHGAKLLRWRDDKAPRECTIDQIQE